MYTWERVGEAYGDWRNRTSYNAMVAMQQTLNEPPRALLQRCCPQLSTRELDVLEGLLLGMSHHGIATDMGLCIGTVKTYRMRAFERLGIQFKSELYAAILNALP